MRRAVLILLAAFVLGFSGVATAAVLSGSSGPGRADAGDRHEDSGVHGGQIDRFQRAGTCDGTALGPLHGNWTHGDYVTAVAESGTPAEISDAAHSDCGKPIPAVGHGGGPPAFALEQMAAGRSHAGGDDEGS